jgi:hypothetical protein
MFDKYLDGFGKITIIETGFYSSRVIELAEYAEKTSSDVHSVDLSMNNLQHLHDLLDKNNLAPFVSLHLQEPTRFLNSKTWVDAVFLNSRVGLQPTLEHVKIAMSIGARLIVTSHYQSEGAWGIQFAKQQGWSVEHDDNGSSFLMRPKP